MITTSDIARALARFDLGPLVGSGSTGHGFVNETAIVTTERGRFVLRRNHRRFAPPSLRYRHELIGHLHQRGVPTAPLVPSRTGETIVVLDGRSYEVQEYVDGADFDPARPAQVASAGATLARYHEAVRGFPPPGPDVGADTEPRYAPAVIHRLTERLLERDVMGELHDPLAWYDARAAWLRRRLPDGAYAALPHLLIHGDVHSDNFRFVADEVSGLLDFDQAAWDARVADLADALVAFATEPDRDLGGAWGVFRGALDLRRAALLLEGYATVSPLGAAELAALPALLEVLWLRGALGRVISTPEGAPEYHLEVLGQGRRLSAWAEEHGGGIFIGGGDRVPEVGALAA